MVEKGNIGGICHAIHQYPKANNKYMKDYDKNKKSSYLKYWDVNNLNVWALFDEAFIKNYNKEREEGHFLEVDLQYPEKLHEHHNDLPFLQKRMKIEKVEKLVTNLHD